MDSNDTGGDGFGYTKDSEYFRYQGEYFRILNKNPLRLQDPFESKQYTVLRDEDDVFTRVQQDGLQLLYAHESLKANKKIGLAAVEQNGLALQFCADSLRNDEEIVWKAFNQNMAAIKFARFPLKKNPKVDPRIIWDPNIVSIAIKLGLNGQILECASDSTKKDREIVLAAVRQNGMALQFADESLKKDREIVLAAVRQNGMALEFADESLQKDEVIVLAAVQQNGMARAFADPSLTGHTGIREAHLEEQMNRQELSLLTEDFEYTQAAAALKEQRVPSRNIQKNKQLPPTGLTLKSYTTDILYTADILYTTKPCLPPPEQFLRYGLRNIEPRKKTVTFSSPPDSKEADVSKKRGMIAFFWPR